MNYLAHAYFSFGDPELLLGNLIADFVKGKQKYEYPLPVRRGIDLHLSIDQFTDKHSATRCIKEIFYKDYGRYGGAFADIVYDHFLALDTSVFPENALWGFSQWVYSELDRSQERLPDKFTRMYPYMKKDNWLYHYGEKWAIQRSFKGLVHRAAYITDSETAYLLFEKEYATIKDCYISFLPDLKKALALEYQLSHSVH